MPKYVRFAVNVPLTNEDSRLGVTDRVMAFESWQRTSSPAVLSLRQTKDYFVNSTERNRSSKL